MIFQWAYDERYDLAVALIPKCGLQSIIAWMGKDSIRLQSNDSLLSVVEKRVAFIRNPIDRLVSAYSFFYWMDHYGKRGSEEIPIDSWESFVDHSLSVENEHWNPQTEMIGEIPNIYHRFENILEHFGKYRPGIFPHHNKSTRRPVTAYRLLDICEKYYKDFDVWLGAD